MLISKLILARDRRRSRLVPKKNSIWTLRRQSAMVSMLWPHLYSPSLEDSTSAKICDVKPVETGERNERFRREKTFFMLATSEETDYVKPPCLWAKLFVLSRLLETRRLDTLRTQRVAYLVQCISFDFMDQDQRNPFL